MALRRRSQAGATLVESILVILLVGIVLLTLATGLLASTVSARKVNNSQRLGLAMTSLTEAVRNLDYIPSGAACTPVTDAGKYLASYNALPAAQRQATAGLRIEFIGIRYWKLQYTSTTVAGFDQWSGLCTDGSGAQKIKVRLTVPDGTPGGQGSATAEVVKRQSGRQGA